MRTRYVLALAAVIGLIASPAHAGALNLRWNDCWGDGGTMNRLFACNTNSGSDQMVASFIPTKPYAGIEGLDAIVVFTTAGASVPPWWQFRTAGSCRLSSLNATASLPATAVNCVDWAGGGSNALITSYVVDALGPGTVRFQVSAAVPSGGTVELAIGQEYFAFTLGLGHQKSVGTGSCAGCDLGACIALQSIALRHPVPDPSEPIFPVGFQSDDRLVLWQGGVGVTQRTLSGLTSCPRATPTRNSAWGAVKALYR